MDLGCALSPLAYAEFYRLLSEQRDWGAVIAERLTELGLPEDWLERAMEDYEFAWQQIVTCQDVDRPGLGPRHAVLATLVLVAARLRGGVAVKAGQNGDCSGFEFELASRVVERYYDAFPGAEGLQPEYRPTVVAWIVGQVIGTLDSVVPVFPALLPDDPNVRTAYLGLVEHAVLLGQIGDSREIGEPLPELMCSAVAMRALGIAEALRPEIDPRTEKVSLRLVVRKLLDETEAFMSSNRHTELARHWERGQHRRTFIAKRNVITHVRDDADAITLLEAIEDMRSLDALRSSLAGTAQFVCQEALQDLLATEEPPMTFDRNVLRQMRRELGIYD